MRLGLSLFLSALVLFTCKSRDNANLSLKDDDSKVIPDQDLNLNAEAEAMRLRCFEAMRLGESKEIYDQALELLRNTSDWQSAAAAVACMRYLDGYTFWKPTPIVVEALLGKLNPSEEKLVRSAVTFGISQLDSKLTDKVDASVSVLNSILENLGFDHSIETSRQLMCTGFILYFDDEKSMMKLEAKIRDRYPTRKDLPIPHGGFEDVGVCLGYRDRSIRGGCGIISATRYCRSQAPKQIIAIFSEFKGMYHWQRKKRSQDGSP